MILNNYQKAMKEIRLSDTQKEEILQNILAKDIQPVKKRNVWLKPSLALVMVVILAVLIMPKGMGKEVLPAGLPVTTHQWPHPQKQSGK
ncbi:MAG: hypothetical protein IKE36_10140 [Solobacterium sp.]|nr:hypothetical protein [Solobacterium sp.]